MLLPQQILVTALKNPGKTACIDDRGEVSYVKLIGGAFHLAEKLDQTTSFERIGIMLPTGSLYPMSILATWMTGRACVPLNYLLGASELKYVIEDSGIDCLVTVRPMIEHMVKTLGDMSFLPDGVKLLYLDDMDFSGTLPLRWPSLPSEGDLAALIYTSGTSGRPKGVMLSHGNLASNSDGIRQHIHIESKNKFLGVLPQFHSFGFTALTLLPLATGCTVIYTARFIPKKIVGLIKKHKPEIMLAVPSMYGALLSVKNLSQADMASLRIAVSGGEPLSNAIREGYQQKLALPLMEGYGLTEISPVANLSTPDAHVNGAVGKAIPGMLNWIVDGSDKPLPAGEEGEILLSGPSVMQGYYGLEKETKEAFVDLPIDETDLDEHGLHAPYIRIKNGILHRRFFRTGDIGKLEENGQLYITGRKKEMLIVSGENVFPREIEEVLDAHESVYASAVIGQTDDMRGEVPIAFIEVAEDATFDDAELRSWCRDRLAGYKVPKEITVVEELPRNPTGKIMRRKLKESLVAN